jgi:predicted SnoaL-like aldol condensation-catalyzing enzyme
MADSNKEATIAFLKLASSGKVREAYSKFVGVGFRHHNPFFEGSVESLLAGMEENARQNPNKVLEVKRAPAEGDLVAVLSTCGTSLATSAQPLSLSTSFGLSRAASSSFGISASPCPRNHPTNMECSSLER